MPGLTGAMSEPDILASVLLNWPWIAQPAVGCRLKGVVFKCSTIRGNEMALLEYHAEVQQTTEDSRVRIAILADEEIRSLPREQAEERLSALLHQLRVRPEFIIYELGTFASYVEPVSREELFGFNTLVEVNLPYTLHLPIHRAFPVRCPQIAVPAVVQLRKIWTDLAAGSSDVEAYADDQPLYCGPARPISPTIPQPPALGPWPHFTGPNVEIQKDTHGVFRYTLARVFFDSIHAALDGPDGLDGTQNARSAAVKRVTEIAARLINYLLDVYRSITGERHVERLARMLVTRIYFADSNLVYESVGIDSGLGSAMVNRPWREIDQFAEMLGAGRVPDRHVLLFQSAHSALDRGQDLLAVVVAFQAQEIIIEKRLRDGYASQSVPDAEVTHKLKTYHRTQDRLTTLSREVFGGRSIADDTIFWDSWLRDCNRKRNAVVHRGEEIDSDGAKRLVQPC
jgi:hypothetical protein